MLEALEIAPSGAYRNQICAHLPPALEARAAGPGTGAAMDGHATLTAHKRCTGHTPTHAGPTGLYRDVPTDGSSGSSASNATRDNTTRSTREDGDPHLVAAERKRPGQGEA